MAASHSTDRVSARRDLGDNPDLVCVTLIGRDQHRASLVACADEFEQHAGLGLILGDISEIVKDHEIEAIETTDGRLEVELTSRHLELLHEIGGAGEQDAPSVLNEGEADRCRQVALAAAGRAEQEQIGALAQPAIAGGKCGHLCLGDHRHGLEVEVVEGLSGRQPRLNQVAFDASTEPKRHITIDSSITGRAIDEISLSLTVHKM